MLLLLKHPVVSQLMYIDPSLYNLIISAEKDVTWVGNSQDSYHYFDPYTFGQFFWLTNPTMA